MSVAPPADWLALLSRLLRSAGDLPSNLAARAQNRPLGCSQSSGQGMAHGKAIRVRRPEDARVVLGKSIEELSSHRHRRLTYQLVGKYAVHHHRQISRSTPAPALRLLDERIAATHL
jgi:hypothetical protein